MRRDQALLAPRRKRWRAAILAAVGVVVPVAAAVVVFSTPVLANLRTEVAAPDTRVTVGPAESPWSVGVPAGWSVQRPLLQEDRLVIGSPDGALELTLTVDDETPQDAFAAQAKRASVPSTPQSEVLESGLTILHSEDESQLVAAIGRPGAGPSVQVLARQRTGEPADYRAAVAIVLNDIRARS